MRRVLTATGCSSRRLGGPCFTASSKGCGCIFRARKRFCVLARLDRRAAAWNFRSNVTFPSASAKMNGVRLFPTRMTRRFSLASVLIAVVLLLGVVPLRSLVSALAATESGGRHCALHGADCECKKHCNREQRQAHHNRSSATAVVHEARAAQASSCHRASPGETAENTVKPAPSDTESSAQVAAVQPSGGCVMTSCGNEAPILLTAQGQPYLAAMLISGPHRQPNFNAAPSSRTLFHSSLTVPPPAPPPKS